MIDGERWEEVPGYEGSYEVSDQGRVRSKDRLVPSKNGSKQFRKGVVLSPRFDKDGYPRVNLYRDQKMFDGLIHRLVMLTFVGPPPEGQEVCHSDGNKENNALANLRYDTKSANAYDTIRHGNHKNANKTRCIRGHELTDDNLFTIGKKRVRQICKVCYKIMSAKHAGQEE